MNHDDNAEIRTKITEGRPEAGSALPVLQFHFADADLGILCHDLLADDPDRAPGGRRQPETDHRRSSYSRYSDAPSLPSMRQACSSAEVP